MIKPVALCFFLTLVGVASPAFSGDLDSSKKLIAVRGYINAHWEYPHFIPDHATGLKVMDFQIREERWQNVYAKPVNKALRFRPDETICFRVTGKGYLAPRQPSSMQPWEGDQFVFVKIQNLERLASDEKCAPHPVTKVR